MQVIAHHFLERRYTTQSSWRPVWGMLLLVVYLFGQIALVPSVVVQLASCSSDHQVVVGDNKVVLHHASSAGRHHHALTQCLVAFSLSNDSGDHVLPLQETQACEDPRRGQEPVFTGDIISCDSTIFRCSLACHILAWHDSSLHDQVCAAEMMIAQWCSVRLLI